MPWVRFNLKKFCGEEVPESELAEYLHTDFDDNVIDKITVVSQQTRKRHDNGYQR